MGRLTFEEVPAKRIRIARKHASARARACDHAASKVNSVDISLCKPHAPCTRDTSPSRRLPIHKYCNCQWEVGSTSSQRPRRVMAHAPLVRAAPCAPESMAITNARSPHCHVHGAMTHHANLPLPFHEVSSCARARALRGEHASPRARARTPPRCAATADAHRAGQTKQRARGPWCPRALGSRSSHTLQTLQQACSNRRQPPVRQRASSG